jgi:cytochrome c biogenesis protein CcdA
MFAWVIATVLPESTLKGSFYLAVYCAGLSTALLLITLFGRRITSRLAILSNPQGWFQKGIGVLFVVVGIFVATGWQKDVQTYLVEKDVFKLKVLEEKLVPAD